MKVDYQIVQKRRDDIMMIIQKLGDVSVKQLMNDFNVSEITIRRDLQYWEDRGAIIRYHGGAKIVQHMVDHDIVTSQMSDINMPSPKWQLVTSRMVILSLSIQVLLPYSSHNIL